MDKSVKHFVRRILAINLLLLALVLAVVTGAARHVYNSARDQALNQARARQTLLAEQTAHGHLLPADGELELAIAPSQVTDEAIYQRANLPQHPLVASGYLSVGCMPCSSRTAPDEDTRAGRWRGRAKTECGIHTNKTS